MATRFYFPNLAYYPSTGFDGYWESAVAGAAETKLSLYKRGTVFGSVAIAETNASSTYDVAIIQGISDQLAEDCIISGTVKGIFLCSESNANANFRSQMLIKVVSENLATVRGYLLFHDASALSNEWQLTTLTNRKFPLNWSGSGTTLNNVQAFAGDRIVIELGYRAHNAVTTSYTGTIRIGDNAASDLAEDETSTTENAPWVEFSQTLLFRSDVASTPKIYNDFIFNTLSSDGYHNYDGYDEPSSSLLSAELSDGYDISALIPNLVLGQQSNGQGFTGLPNIEIEHVYYLMRGTDVDCMTQPTYRIWKVVNSPDFTGAQYTGARCGASSLANIVIAATWSA